MAWRRVIEDRGDERLEGTVLKVLGVIAGGRLSDQASLASRKPEFTKGVDRFLASGQMEVEWLQAATEGGLRAKLAEKSWDVVHMFARVQERSAGYGTIALVGADGGERQVTANAFASLVARCGAGHDAPVKLVVLQGCDETADCFGVITQALLAAGVGAVCTTRWFVRFEQYLFLERLYRGVLGGMSVEALEEQMVQEGVRLAAIDVRREIMVDVGTRMATGGEVPEKPKMPDLPLRRIVNEEAERVKRELERKRSALAFDVFLCHNSADKPAVRQMGTALKLKGLLPWLDVWELPPGQMWQPLLERQIDRILAAAVFVGAAGMGPWQTQEMYGFLREFVKRGAPVIPVLLPDAPVKPELPLFLRGLTWVDFRAAEPDPMRQLIWGITGERPED